MKDVLLDKRFQDNLFVTGEPFIRFYAGYPLHLPDGAVAGMLCLLNSTPRYFSEEDIALLKGLAFIREDEFQVIYMAMTDILIGIPNRRAFLWPCLNTTIPVSIPADDPLFLPTAG